MLKQSAKVVSGLRNDCPKTVSCIVRSPAQQHADPRSKEWRKLSQNLVAVFLRGPARHLSALRQKFDSPPSCGNFWLPKLPPPPQGRVFFLLSELPPSVRAIARQVSGKNCLAAIFASRPSGLRVAAKGSPILCAFCVRQEKRTQRLTWVQRPRSSNAKLRIWTLRIWGFPGPGFLSARQVLCGDASRLCLDHFSKRLSCVLGRTDLCHKVWNPRPQKPQIIRNENHPWPLFDLSRKNCPVRLGVFHRMHTKGVVRQNAF